MDNLYKISDTKKIVELFERLEQGKLLWIKISNARRGCPKAYIAIFEYYTKEAGHCTVTTGPFGSQVVHLQDIVEIAQVSLPKLVHGLNEILLVSTNFE